jgi:hypothetical protein
MKRFITAMLTLALITGLSCGKASAQQANAVPLLGLSMQSSNGDIAGDPLPIAGVDRLIPLAESFVTSVESMGQASRNTSDSLTNLDLAFTPTGENCHLRYERLNVVDPYACPNDRIASGSNLHHTFEGYIMDPDLHINGPLLPWHGR